MDTNMLLPSLAVSARSCRQSSVTTMTVYANEFTKTLDHAAGYDALRLRVDVAMVVGVERR
ncbi:hypothetical protein F441_09622 [Phytophthora nicotianae CJ01A1]|uniref:Uncharacterized protein n=6 Tax=Phytophthora nicotianae TaxID=4792 RepID=W2R6H7_PHYN3|nr:hypothetical protein PPTG_21015 [Phytophthora nicotianae INRA-310]ETI45847.1 hypothetical protein F443_09687 [Phytophthora nicotianae P1569]ETL92346.1 hypothetical protein L917_09323 [Phytophthora nicotianae]ETO74537.1 hypothetical protein F444_09751 [Phytophthora nicotianae P1976]ETP15669.1 hypothetical protein F441_09622 [Phytophthora nicotianae CJ01A1]ETP43728.1 hypothetical protein F442_09594 [Phytophthora nicotianae P10297]